MVPTPHLVWESAGTDEPGDQNADSITRNHAGNTTQTDGYNTIMALVRMDDWHDPKGAAYGWMSALADVAYVEYDDILPGYRPSVLVQHGQRHLIDQDSNTAMILESVDAGSVDLADITAVFLVLSRMDDIFKLGDRY